MLKPTLSKAEAAFTHWREHRSKPKEPIPHYLWDIVAQLRQYHNQTDICRRLKINGTQFSNKMTEYDANTANRNDAFVTVQHPQPAVQSQTTISLQSGEKTLSLSVDLKEIGVVLSHFKNLI